RHPDSDQPRHVLKVWNQQQEAAGGRWLVRDAEFWLKRLLQVSIQLYEQGRSQFLIRVLELLADGAAGRLSHPLITELMEQVEVGSVKVGKPRAVVVGTIRPLKEDRLVVSTFHHLSLKRPECFRMGLIVQDLQPELRDLAIEGDTHLHAQ